MQSLMFCNIGGKNRRFTEAENIHMPEIYRIERQIEIDAGHRVPHHASKCKNLHGHRYKIIAVCDGGLIPDGEEGGMVMDFGFLKEEMMHAIHDCCDHSLIVWVDDPLVQNFINNNKRFHEEIRPQIDKAAYYATEQSLVGALYIIDNVPTAENLAAHWYRKLQTRIQKRSNGNAVLRQIKVYETPNCMAAYPV